MRAFNGPMKTGRNSLLPIELSDGGRFVCSRENFVPAYLRAFEEGILQERADEAIEALRSCRVCPHCEIDRLNNKIGVCKSGRLARVASAFPHFGEEDCLRGWNGSGTRSTAENILSPAITPKLRAGSSQRCTPRSANSKWTRTASPYAACCCGISSCQVCLRTRERSCGGSLTHSHATLTLM